MVGSPKPKYYAGSPKEMCSGAAFHFILEDVKFPLFSDRAGRSATLHRG
jgi:hypothetical protein